VIRRMCLVGSAVAAASLVVGFGVTAALAKGTHHKGTPTVKSVAVIKCHVFLSTVPPPGSPAVDQPPAQGAQYGPAHCTAVGAGVASDTFKVPDSGDTIGSYVVNFATSSIHGKFNLTPSEASGNLSSTSFESQSWVGTVTVTGGTGQYAGAAAKDGVMKCTSGDTVHLRCTETIPLTKL
jgi:hypothetical protein